MFCWLAFPDVPSVSEDYMIQENQDGGCLWLSSDFPSSSLYFFTALSMWWHHSSSSKVLYRFSWCTFTCYRPKIWFHEQKGGPWKTDRPFLGKNFRMLWIQKFFHIFFENQQNVLILYLYLRKFFSLWVQSAERRTQNATVQRHTYDSRAYAGTCVPRSSHGKSFASSEDFDVRTHQPLENKV